MYMPLLKVHPFFDLINEANQMLMGRVCHKALSRLTLSRGDVLYNTGEVAPNPAMYFVISGKMRYICHNDSIVICQAGDWSSEAALWVNWAHCGTMGAKTDCVLLVLDAEKFRNIAECFPIELDNASKYGDGFVRHLNMCHPDDLTDLDDPSQAVHWLAKTSFYHSETPKSPASTKSGHHHHHHLHEKGLFKGVMRWSERSSQVTNSTNSWTFSKTRSWLPRWAQSDSHRQVREVRAELSNIMASPSSSR